MARLLYITMEWLTSRRLTNEHLAPSAYSAKAANALTEYMDLDIIGH